MGDGTSVRISGHCILNKVELFLESGTVAVVVWVSGIGKEDGNAIAHWVACRAINDKCLAFWRLVVNKATRQGVSITCGGGISVTHYLALETGQAVAFKA
jgi:hypothetical protein